MRSFPYLLAPWSFSLGLFVVGCSAASGSDPTEPTEDELVGADKAVSDRAPEFADTEKVFAKEGIAVVRTPGGGILLRASSAARAASALGALRTLRTKETGVDVPGPALRTRSSGWSEAKIDTLLTPYLAQTLDKVVDVQSDCWGHSAAVTGLVTGVKELSASGFTAMLASPMCRQLGQGEAAATGDIVSLRAVDEQAGVFTFEEVHTAVVVNDELWSSKNGSGRFEIATPASILTDYVDGKLPESCQKRSGLPLSAAELRTCKGVIEMYRCESAAAYRSRVGGSFQTYDTLITTMGPLSWETIQQQRAAEEAGDAVIPKGLAYVSKYAYDPVGTSYLLSDERMPKAVSKKLAQMAADPFLGARYDLSQPAVPPLAFAFDSNGFERLRTAYQAAEAKVFAALDAPLSASERPLVELLFLEVTSSQLSDSGRARSKVAEKLEAPDRKLVVR